MAFEPLAVFGREIFRADDDDGDFPPVLVLLEFGDHLEAVHHGHPQIEHDERGAMVRDAFECFETVGGGAHLPVAVFEHPAQHRARVRFVLDDEDVAGGRKLMIFFQHAEEPVAVNRLLQIIRDAKREAEILIRPHAQHDDGNRREFGIGLEQRQHDPAVHLGHDDVERDDARAQFLRETEAIGAVQRELEIVALGAERFREQPVHAGVVVNDEDAAAVRTPRDVGVGLVGDGDGNGVGRRGHLLGQLDDESGTDAGLAFDAHAASEHLAEVFCEREAEAGAAVAARGRVVRL